MVIMMFTVAQFHLVPYRHHVTIAASIALAALGVEFDVLTYQVIHEQKASKALHPHYRELGRIILKNCSESIKDADQISQFIEV